VTSISSRAPDTANVHPRLVVEPTHTTPARTGVLLVGRLEAGEVEPGQKLAAELLGGEQLEVVVRAVDSVAGSDEDGRTVGLLLEPTDAKRLVPGTVLTAPQAIRRTPAVSAQPAELRVPEVVKLSIELPDSRTRVLIFAGVSILAIMSSAVFVLATFYVVTDQEARTPILVSLIASFAAIFTAIVSQSAKSLVKHGWHQASGSIEREDPTRSAGRRG